MKGGKEGKGSLLLREGEDGRERGEREKRVGKKKEGG